MAGSHAFLWPNGTMTNLGTPAPYNGSRAFSINDSGQVVGVAFYGTTQVAVLWQHGTSTILGQFTPVGINNLGQVAGVVGGTSLHSVLWQNGTLTTLATPGYSHFAASGINDAGQVSGTANTVINGYVVSRSLIWSHGTTTDLGTLPGDNTGGALCISNSGQVAGSSGHVNPYTDSQYYRYTPGTSPGPSSPGRGLNADSTDVSAVAVSLQNAALPLAATAGFATVAPSPAMDSPSTARSPLGTTAVDQYFTASSGQRHESAEAQALAAARHTGSSGVSLPRKIAYYGSEQLSSLDEAFAL